MYQTNWILRSETTQQVVGTLSFQQDLKISGDLTTLSIVILQSMNADFNHTTKLICINKWQ